MIARRFSLGILMVALGTAACSSDDDGGGASAGTGGAAGQAGSSGLGGTGDAGSGGSAGTGGSAGGGLGGAGGSAGGGSGGTAGSAGAPIDIYCEEGYNQSCFCLADPNDVFGPDEGVESCSETSVGNGLCCRDVGYPGGIDDCTCSRWGCWESTATCNCGFGDEASKPQLDCQNPWAYCCANSYSNGAVFMCTCSNYPCTGDTMEVPNCSVDYVTCESNQLPTSVCL